MIIPEGFVHCVIGFVGPPAPLGAAITFGVANSLDLALNVLASSIEDDFAAATVQACFTDTLATDVIKLKAGPNDTGASAEFPFAFDGSSTGTATSPQVALLCQKRTALGGKKGRGRFYLPGQNEALIDESGNVDATYRGDVADILFDFMGKLAVATTPMVVLHNSATAPTLVTDITVSPVVATQRRRVRR